MTRKEGVQRIDGTDYRNAVFNSWQALDKVVSWSFRARSLWRSQVETNPIPVPTPPGPTQLYEKAYGRERWTHPMVSVLHGKLMAVEGGHQCKSLNNIGPGVFFSGGSTGW